MKRFASLLLIGSLCGVALVAASKTQKKKSSTSNLHVTQIAGKKLFQLKNCVDCHTLAKKADGKLTPVANKRDDAWFSEHVAQESPIVLQKAKSKRRQKRVLKKEVAALDDFLYQSKPEEKKQISGLTEDVFDGAYLVYQNNCVNCHSIAGAGKEIAPDLTHIAKEHGDKEWLIKNLINPQQFAPESLMPKFNKLPEADLEKIAEYLLTLE